MMRHFSLLVLAALMFSATPHVARADDPPPQASPKPKPPEFLQMFGSIVAHGSDMGPYSGWFKPSESRFTWTWLADRFDANHDGAVTADEMKGFARQFRTLDRDGDGSVKPEDLDWTPKSQYLQSRALARGRFGRMDTNGNGRVTLAEWSAAFEQAAKEKGFLTQEELADFLYASPPRPPATTPAPEGPSRLTLLKGLFSGEIGSFTEGPDLGANAPAFTLPTHDKERTISLADYRGKKPVVLIFGSFT